MCFIKQVAEKMIQERDKTGTKVQFFYKNTNKI